MAANPPDHPPGLAETLAGVGGMAGRCAQLADEEGGALGDADVCALAGQVLASHLESQDQAEAQALLDVVEGLAARATLDDAQVLAWALFSPLPAETTSVVAAMCGPATARLLHALDDDSLDPDSWAHESSTDA